MGSKIHLGKHRNTSHKYRLPPNIYASLIIKFFVFLPLVISNSRWAMFLLEGLVNNDVCLVKLYRKVVNRVVYSFFVCTFYYSRSVAKRSTYLIDWIWDWGIENLGDPWRNGLHGYISTYLATQSPTWMVNWWPWNKP